MKSIRRVYIAGKISGEDYETVCRKFDSAESYVPSIVAALQDVYDIQYNDSTTVFNPTHICDNDWPWFYCMFVCLLHVLVSDLVVLLPDWRDSRGATIEYKFAKFLNKIIVEI